MELPAPGGAGRLALVPLLCALLGAVAPASAKAGTPTAAAAAGGSGLGRRLSLNSGEVTLDSLESVDDRGELGGWEVGDAGAGHSTPACRRPEAGPLPPAPVASSLLLLQAPPRSWRPTAPSCWASWCRQGPAFVACLLVLLLPFCHRRCSAQPASPAPPCPLLPAAGQRRRAPAGGGAAAGALPGARGGGCGALPALLCHRRWGRQLCWCGCYKRGQPIRRQLRRAGPTYALHLSTKLLQAP